jgi:adenosylcobinamide-phosphate synthase
MSVALLSVAGVALDALLGEPRRNHPLVAFGRFAERIEQRLNAAGRCWRSHGVTAWFIAVVPLTLIATLLSWLPFVGWLVEVLALYCALGLRSLGEHVEPVAQALRSDNLDEAPKWPVRPLSRCWKTAAMRCSRRSSGLLCLAHRASCFTA